MTVKEMRSALKLSQTAFSEKYKIPKRTIENWETGVSKCPDYVHDLLERAVCDDINGMQKRMDFSDLPQVQITIDIDRIHGEKIMEKYGFDFKLLSDHAFLVAGETKNDYSLIWSDGKNAFPEAIPVAYGADTDGTRYTVATVAPGFAAAFKFQ